MKDIEMFPQFNSKWRERERQRQREYESLNKKHGPVGSAAYQELNEKYKEHIESGVDIRIPSFERLAIIYEKQGNIEEALRICELAIKYGLRDSTKGGFEGRLEKLKAKYKKII